MTANDAMLAPGSVEHVTPEWFTVVLQNAGLLAPSNAVVSATPAALGDGQGETGLVARVSVAVADPNDPAGPPTSVIMKFQTDNSARREIAASLDLYEREIRFYRDFGSNLPISVPRCLFAGSTTQGGTVLILEDFAALVPGDEVAGCSPDQARLAVGALGDLHGKFWKSPRLEQVGWLSDPVTPYGEQFIRIGRAGWDHMVETYGRDLPKRLTTSRDAFFRTMASLQQWLAADNNTLIHGDFRLDNLLFGQDDDTPQIVVLDWQVVSRSRGVQDVAYLLSHSMSAEDRRSTEDELLDIYCSRLAAAGIEYPIHECREDYRKAVLYCFMAVVSITGAMKNNSERALRRKDELIRRSVSSLEETDALGLLVAN